MTSPQQEESQQSHPEAVGGEVLSFCVGADGIDHQTQNANNQSDYRWHDSSVYPSSPYSQGNPKSFARLSDCSVAILACRSRSICSSVALTPGMPKTWRNIRSCLRRFCSSISSSLISLRSSETGSLAARRLMQSTMPFSSTSAKWTNWRR